jgi:hypothetical protein
MSFSSTSGSFSGFGFKVAGTLAGAATVRRIGGAGGGGGISANVCALLVFAPRQTSSNRETNPRTHFISRLLPETDTTYQLIRAAGPEEIENVNRMSALEKPLKQPASQLLVA